jgi:hypothetical protein
MHTFRQLSKREEGIFHKAEELGISSSFKRQPVLCPDLVLERLSFVFGETQK